MSRSGYEESDGTDQWAMIRWAGMLASAKRGRRGQRFFRELVEALDAMPVKELVAEELVWNGQVCAMGALAQHRGVSLDDVDPNETGTVARRLDIAVCLAQETAFWNDDPATPAERWSRMRAWAQSQIREEAPR